MSAARITGFGHAVPARIEHDRLWDAYFHDYFGGSPAARRIWRSVEVKTRHGVALPPALDISSASTGARMAHYAHEAPQLGKAAVAAALDAAGVAAGDIGLLAVVSCTGYSTPGLDVVVARDLGLPADVQRLLIGHMGCYAALPGLGAVSDFVTARGRPAVLLCVELPSLHIQPRPQGRPDLEQVVAHALFADAAAAAVVLPGAATGGRAVRGWRLVDIVALTDTSVSDHMTWDVTDTGFRMGLSPRVPDVLAEQVRPAVTGMLAGHGLDLAAVGAWAVHPGGPRILDVVGERLALPEGALDTSRAVLRDFGNCSSATVLLVLDRLQAAGARDAGCAAPPYGRPGVRPGARYAVALAFGPGLTLYGALLDAGPDARGD